MAGVPNWSAARAGLLGDTGAVNHANQIDQFLGAHGITALFQGAAVLTPSNARGNGAQDPATYWVNRFGAFDYDQPFTMSGTAIGRIEVPILPVGSGADLLVSLCPDSSGNPGVPLATVRIPAKWITQFSATAAAAGPDNSVQLVSTSGPLAVSQFNSLTFGVGASAPWGTPAASGMGAASNPASNYSGNYFIQVGGYASGGAPPQVASVFTLNWQSGTALGSAVPQPSLPTATNGSALAATTGSLVCAGGQTGSPATATANVYTAGWNATTGQIASWSSQASLPQAVTSAYAAAWNNTVYVVGGANGSNVPINTVYWATVTNGQLQTWNTATMPVAVVGPFVAVIGNWLIVAGGYTTTMFNATTAAVNYAPINADGSLGPWQAAPSMPVACANVGNGMAATSSGMVLISGYTGSVYTSAIQSLSFGPSGPGEWQLLGFGSTADSAIFTVGAGQWRAFSFVNAPTYSYADAYATPRISVPMALASLTNGATYHVLLQQAGGDLNNYLRGPVENQGVFPGSPTYLSRAKGSSTWAAGVSGSAIPISIFDQSAGGQPWHMWEDGGNRISTLVWNTTPDATLLGIAEAITQPGPVLNANPTFTAGTVPWTVTGGTLTQSSTHVHGNLPDSGLLTPSGSAGSSYAESEKVAVFQGHNYVATAWLYSGPGYANCAVNINWYNASSTFLSTTSGTVMSLAAGTWTQLSTATTGGIPANAAYGTIVAIETGTPPSSATLWISAATLQDTSGAPLSSVTQVNYAAPGLGQRPTGITQLA